MQKIKDVSIGKDFNSATVEIITQDGNLRKLKLTYDSATKSLSALTMGEKHYTTAGERFSNAVKDKVRQFGAYLVAQAIVYELIQVAQRGVGYVTDLNTALKELQLVTK